MADIIWGDKRLVLHEFKRNHANGGRLGKFWIEDEVTGKQFLIKGSTPFSYEPYSEKMAYIIGKNLGIDVLEYDIIPASLFKGLIKVSPFCNYLSICEKIDRRNYSITSVAEIKRARNIVKGENEKAITNREVMYEVLDESYIDTMILFDAIIGNVDRHYGNVHILRSTDGEMIGAPLLDNGASLLSQSSAFIDFIFKENTSLLVNNSNMIDTNHDKEIKRIRSLRNINFNITAKTIQILDELEPTLQLLHPIRRKAVKRYIVYRLHKYLGEMKRHDYNNITSESNKEEKEHT